MNILRFSNVFLVLFSILLLVSCTDEPIDSLLASQTQQPENNNGGSGGLITAPDYWPTALNNEWIMKFNGVEQTPMKIISIDNIDNHTYFTFNQATGQGGGAIAGGIQRIRKNAGDYYIKLENISINAGVNTGTQTGYEMLFFKDYLNVGETWTGSYEQTTTYTNPQIPVISMNTTYTGTILETAATVSVNGVSYTNVIKMKIHQIVETTGLPTSQIDTEYWMAKDVGPLKTIVYSAGTTTPQSTSELVAYTLN